MKKKTILSIALIITSTFIACSDGEKYIGIIHYMCNSSFSIFTGKFIAIRDNKDQENKRKSTLKNIPKNIGPLKTMSCPNLAGTWMRQLVTKQTMRKGR